MYSTPRNLSIPSITQKHPSPPYINILFLNYQVVKWVWFWEAEDDFWVLMPPSHLVLQNLLWVCCRRFIQFHRAHCGALLHPDSVSSKWNWQSFWWNRSTFPIILYEVIQWEGLDSTWFPSMTSLVCCRFQPSMACFSSHSAPAKLMLFSTCSYLLSYNEVLNDTNERCPTGILPPLFSFSGFDASTYMTYPFR